MAYSTGKRLHAAFNFDFLKFKWKPRLFLNGVQRWEQAMDTETWPTYVLAPEVLTPTLELRARPGTYLAGQISGVEGYLESAATGLWLGLFLAGKRDLPPVETALGALLGHLRTPAKHFQPSNVHFGLMPALNRKAPKKKRKELYAQRAREVWKRWMDGDRE